MNHFIMKTFYIIIIVPYSKVNKVRGVTRFNVDYVTCSRGFKANGLELTFVEANNYRSLLFYETVLGILFNFSC